MMEKAVSIRKSIQKIAHLEDKALISSLGIDCCSVIESHSKSKIESNNNSVNSNIQEKLFDSMTGRKWKLVQQMMWLIPLFCNDESVEVFLML